MDLYNIPNDNGVDYRIKKFVEYQHEVPSIHYRFLGEWVKKYGYGRNRAVDMCWYMSVTYNEITCVLLDKIDVNPEETWRKHKNELDFGSARKYAKNMDWYVDLMNEWEYITSGEPYLWLMKHDCGEPELTYKSVQKDLKKLKYVGRFAVDLFLEQVVYLKDYFGLDIKEPLSLDWRNCGNLTSGIFNIFYHDEKANLYDKKHIIGEDDEKLLTMYLFEIQKEISRKYPEQNNDITMFVGKICSFRNLFKGRRYGGFHHDRELGVINNYKKSNPEQYDLWEMCLELRKEIFPEHLLGEINGWSGIRKHRNRLWLEKGLTGVESEAK